jgi:hypothetical protein
MNKKLSYLGLLIIVITALTFSAFTQQEKNKNSKNEQKEKQQKNHDNKGKADKTKTNGDDNNGQSTGKMKHNNNQGKMDKNGNNGKSNAAGKKAKKDDLSHLNKDKHEKKDGYEWNRTNFKDRRKIKSQEKVNVCHKFKSNSEPAVSISVSVHALKAHMNHGDVMGNCPAGTKGDFSDIFLHKRTDYYNSIQNSQEQVLYSRSVLDYALSRLTNSRMQLAAFKNNNMPVADIERKQATVAELEQNVSLLKTLIVVAANMVVNKL